MNAPLETATHLSPVDFLRGLFGGTTGQTYLCALRNSDSKLPKGVPANRGGHGMPKQLLIEELTAAGFQVVASPTGWPAPDYCVVFKKSK